MLQLPSPSAGYREPSFPVDALNQLPTLLLASDVGLDSRIQRKLDNIDGFPGPYHLLKDDLVTTVETPATVGYAVIVQLVDEIDLDQPTGAGDLACYCCTGAVVDDNYNSSDIAGFLRTMFQPIIRKFVYIIE